tara:strand:- start:33859 stop:34935 length:1077 start_codon:yes stop_codon:yes gene_type:complete
MDLNYNSDSDSDSCINDSYNNFYFLFKDKNLSEYEEIDIDELKLSDLWEKNFFDFYETNYSYNEIKKKFNKLVTNDFNNYIFNDNLLTNSILFELQILENECLKRKMIPTENIIEFCISIGKLEKYKLLKSFGTQLTDDKIIKCLVEDNFIIGCLDKMKYNTIINLDKVKDIINYFSEIIIKKNATIDVYKYLSNLYFDFTLNNKYFNRKYYIKNLLIIFENANLKFDKKLLLETLNTKDHFDIKKYNIEIDDEILDKCHENNYYPFGKKLTDNFIMKSLKNPNKKLITEISKEIKFEKKHLRVALESKILTSINIILKTYKPDISDFEFYFDYQLNSCNRPKKTDFKILRKLYDATK